jgi:hypothetical protein
MMQAESHDAGGILDAGAARVITFGFYLNKKNERVFCQSVSKKIRYPKKKDFSSK